MKRKNCVRGERSGEVGDGGNVEAELVSEGKTASFRRLNAVMRVSNFLLSNGKSCFAPL